MARILFVDHGFHAKTASSLFFQTILRDRFEVDVVLVDPDRPDPALLCVPADIFAVVVWQLDYLAPVFLAQGVRTLVVPMYDGSSGMPDEHFTAARAAGFVNFSRALHERVRMLGLQSQLLRYFPPPAREDTLPNFDVLRGFLWRRRPEDGIDLPLVRTLFGGQLASLHLHDTPDNAALAGCFPVDTAEYSFTITQSRWFPAAADYLARLEGCNVFIAPRPAEGIGIAMLEAMARGMLVVAHDQPTHDEYICNWVNGVLFNKDAPGPADFTDAAAIGRRAWRSVCDGHAAWATQADGIAGFIEALPVPKPLGARDTDRLLRMIPRAFAQGRATYDRAIAGVVGMGLLDPISDCIEAPPLRFVVGHARAAPTLSPPLQADDTALGVIAFGHGQARPFLRHGWSFDEPDWTWVEGLRASLMFRLPGTVDGDVAMTCLAWTAHAAHPEPLRVGILLNGRFAGEFLPGEGIVAAAIRLPAFMLRADADNELVFVMSNAFAAANDQRVVSCAFCRLEFAACGTVASPALAPELAGVQG